METVLQLGLTNTGSWARKLFTGQKPREFGRGESKQATGQDGSEAWSQICAAIYLSYLGFGFPFQQLNLGALFSLGSLF